MLCYGGAGVVLFHNTQCTVLAMRTYLDSIDVSKAHRRFMTHGYPQTEMNGWNLEGGSPALVATGGIG